MDLLIIIFIIGVSVGVGLGAWLKRLSKRATEGRVIYTGQSQEKEENIGKVLAFIWEHGRITNNQIEELLGVSDATATRYLDELEGRGKIIQKGDGRSTYYELK
jgi:predicted HTH transcriptional regulator